MSAGSSLKSRPPEDRQLTLDDTQGMFLLMGAGFALAWLALFAESCVFFAQNPICSCSFKHMLSIVYPVNAFGSKSIQSQISSDGFDQYFGSCTKHSFEYYASVQVEKTPKYTHAKAQSEINVKSDYQNREDKRLSIWIYKSDYNFHFGYLLKHIMILGMKLSKCGLPSIFFEDWITFQILMIFFDKLHLDNDTLLGSILHRHNQKALYFFSAPLYSVRTIFEHLSLLQVLTDLLKNHLLT